MSSNNSLNHEEECKTGYGVKSDRFEYEGEVFEVEYTATHNVNLSNEGTPFVCGHLVSSHTSKIKLKTFLIKKWL